MSDQEVGRKMEEVMMTWEEQIYWKHFHAMHFYQVLPHDFLHHLVLPSKFGENMSGEIPKKVTLIGPSGSSWEVEVSMTGDLTLVGEGWKDFARTYNLEENYLLMFKYTQDLRFEVLIFDQENLCEKECSYFVKKCSPNPNNTIDRTRSADEITTTEIMEDYDDGGGSDSAISKKLKKCSADYGEKDVVENPRATLSDTSSDDFSNDAVEVVRSGGRPIHQVSVSLVPNEADVPEGIPTAGLVPTNSMGQSAGKPSDSNTTGIPMLSQPNTYQQTPTGNEKNEMYEAVILSPDNNGNAVSKALSAEVNGNGTPGTSHSRKVSAKRGRPVKRAIPRSRKKLAFKRDMRRLSVEYMSHRRAVTDEEKAAALKRATEASTEDSFLVVMQPTGVYKTFYLSIPADWVNQNLSCQHQKVILCVGEKTWAAMFHNYSRGRHSGGLATGWKNFAIENNLEDSDVCIFKPASQKGDLTLIFDVNIFRVVPEITPLTPLLCSIV